jgi:hypothetical protein
MVAFSKISFQETHKIDVAFPGVHLPQGMTILNARL